MYPPTLHALVALSGAILLGVIVGTTHQSPRVAVPESPGPHVKRLAEADIHRLIANLGSEDFREREAAVVALKRRPEAALALLRANRATDNLEVKDRLASILPMMMSREEAEKRLARLPEYVKHHQLDRFVETMVTCREFVTAEHESQIRAFVKDTLNEATGGRKVSWIGEIPEFKALPADNPPRRYSLPPIIARTARDAMNQRVVVSDQIEGGTARNSVILCNGDVDVRGVTCGVVIATGSVRLGITPGTGSADAAMIVCLGDVLVDTGGGVIIVTAGQLRSASGTPLLEAQGSIIREKDAAFFSTWKLYSATEAGAKLRSAFGVVWVEAVTPDGRFAKAGVKPGDILSSIDGVQVGRVREANRMLCRGAVSWGATDIRVVRDNAKRDVIVTLHEW